MRHATTLNGFISIGALAGAIIAMPIASSGCGRTACFVYTQGEYDAHGTCPAQGAALVNFTDPHCPGPVLSVDGAGTFSLNSTDPAQSLCCYSVTQKDLEQSLGNGCTPPTGAGGAGGFNSSMPGFSATSGFGETAVGVGASSSGGGCVTCAVELGSFGADPSALCPQAAMSWSALMACICDGAGPCVTPCTLNFCKDTPLSKECVSCLETPATSGCSAELSACQSN